MRKFFVPCVFLGVLTCLVLFLPSSRFYMPWAAAEPVRTVSQMSQAEIGQKVEDTLRNTVYLEVTANVIQEKLDGSGHDKPLTIRSSMAKDAFKTLVYDNSGQLIRAFAQVDDVSQEFSPERGINEYKSKYRNGIGTPEHGHQVDCLLGNHMFSWVDVSKGSVAVKAMDAAASMRSKIESKSVQQPDSIEQGRTCYVFKQTLAYPPDEKVEYENVVYVDKETFYVIRWDITRFSEGVVIRRKFRITTAKEVPKIDWKISSETQKIGSKN